VAEYDGQGGETLNIARVEKYCEKRGGIRHITKVKEFYGEKKENNYYISRVGE
jgi:hypothetical protein